MPHIIEVYVHVRGRFLHCTSIRLTDATRIGETIRFIQISERFSEPNAIFVVMVDGEIVTEGEY